MTRKNQTGQVQAGGIVKCNARTTGLRRSVNFYDEPLTGRCRHISQILPDVLNEVAKLCKREEAFRERH